MRRPEFSRAIESLWYGQSAFSVLLLPFSWVFGVCVRLRRLAYARGLLASTKLPVPVIVVGNVTVGGAGKTPVVEWAVGTLRAAGFRPGIVSRGYGARSGVRPRVVTDDAGADEVGDEPLLLRRRTGVPVCISADRVAAGRTLLAAGDVDVIVADDGLQHYRLQRDIEIAVVDGVRRLGNGRLLPAGPLREAPGRLTETDMVLVNGGPVAGREFGFRLEPGSASRLDGSQARPLGSFAGQRVRMVAGIANPARFRRLLEESGITVDRIPVPDHGRCDIEALLRASAAPVFMTEKDAVKYPDPPSGPVWTVPVKVRMTDERAKDNLVERVRALQEPGGSQGQ